MENSAPCTPAGKPIRTISKSACLSKRNARKEKVVISWSFCSLISIHTKENAFAAAVANATPSTDIPNTSTKNRLSKTFAIPATASATRGVFASPFARKIALR